MIGALLAWLLAAQPAPTPQPCTERGAVRTTVTEIRREPARFLDRCVTVSGPFAGVTMFSGREGMYLLYRYGADGNSVPANQLHRIGIDSQDLRSMQLRYPQVTRVTGRVDSCQRRSERIVAAGGIPFLGGYCHYHEGPTIVVDSYAITSERIERMTGEAARARFGNLVPMPADWPGRPGAEAIAGRFLAALRAGDRAALRELHGMRDESNDYDRQVLALLLSDERSVFAGLRRAAPSQIAFFVSGRQDGQPLLIRDPEAQSASFVCACRTADCSDRWPITFNDANNAADRPYACTHIVSGGGLRTPARGGWLVEPSRTAFRASASRSTR